VALALVNLTTVETETVAIETLGQVALVVAQTSPLVALGCDGQIEGSIENSVQESSARHKLTRRIFQRSVASSLADRQLRAAVGRISLATISGVTVAIGEASRASDLALTSVSTRLNASGSGDLLRANNRRAVESRTGRLSEETSVRLSDGAHIGGRTSTRNRSANFGILLATIRGKTVAIVEASSAAISDIALRCRALDGRRKVESGSGIEADLAARTAILGVVGGVDLATGRGLASANSKGGSASQSLANTDVALVRGSVSERALSLASTAVSGIIGSLNFATVGNRDVAIGETTIASQRASTRAASAGDDVRASRGAGAIVGASSASLGVRNRRLTTVGCLTVAIEETSRA